MGLVNCLVWWYHPLLEKAGCLLAQFETARESSFTLQVVEELLEKRSDFE